LSNDSIHTYPSQSILEIKEDTLSKQMHNQLFLAHIPKDKTPYFSVMAGVLTVPDLDLGISITASAGYQFNRFLAVGGGIGYMTGTNVAFVPVYAQLRSHFMKTSASLYTELNVGYGFGFNSPFSYIFGPRASVEGGFYAYPSIGFRFKSKQRTHTTIELGYIIQLYKESYTDFFTGASYLNNNPFLRITAKVGVVF
ncbi:MAG: hypothetical protein MK212_22300, partial [Saprospiraceae bacterium]|nr:hypothetical protein [Saprospiraceae bacterium]